MSLRITRKGILPVILLLTILGAMAGIMTRYVQAESVAAKQLSSQYLNSVKKYLNMSDQKTSSYDFNIKNSSKEDGATYTWYIRLDKGNPDSIKIDQKTGVVTAVKAGTAYIRCKITLTDGTILRPEASVIVRNNITEVSISNIPEDLTIEAGKVKDFNRSVLNTDAGKGVKTQGITRWEVAKDTAGVGTVNLKGEVLPLKMGEFNIRAICFQSKERYKLWLSDKAKYAEYVTAASEWVTIKVTDVKEAATAATQEQLDILLQSDDIKQIAITTDKEITFVIPKGDYTSKTLIVNAKNADVENYGIFKDIIINAIKDHTWIEFADGNIIYLNDDIVSFIIEKDVKVKQIIIDRPNSAINLEIRGTVEQIHVLQPSNLDIGGNSQDIPVTVAETAGGSSIQTSVPLNLVFMADTQVKLNKGAEGTVLDKSSSAQIEIENNTEASVRITTEKSGGETVESGTSVVSNGTSNPTQTPAPSLVSITAISGIIGTPQVGVELSAGAVSPVEATVNYQWKISTSENGSYTNIPGATFPKYTPVVGDQGNYIKVTATGTGSFTGSVTSLASAAVLASESKLQEEAETAITAYENAAIVTLTDVATAEGLKAAADTAVNNVGDATIKAAFEQRITNRASEIALVRAELETQLDAELAVAAYEIGPITTLAEVTAAEGLKAAADTAVFAIGNAAVKAALGIRIINRTTVIAETRAELETQAAANAAVTAYEVAPISTLGEVLFAEGLKAPTEAAVSAVGDVAVKTALGQRIADRAIEIAEARLELVAEMEADLAVTAYEMASITTLTEVTVAESMKAAADTAVSLVGNVAVKAALEQRITNRAAEIAEVRARFEAELAVIAYEVAPITTLAEVAAAESRKATADTAVSAVGDMAVKTALEVRITNRAVVIAEARTELEAELDAELAIVAYETAPITTLTEVAVAEGLKATADTAVLSVGNATVKEAMELRITNRAIEIAGARTEFEAEIEAQLDAELAVATYEAAPITTLAEITGAEGLKIAADAAVSAVGDVAVKAAFGLRITNRAAEIAEVRTELEAEAAANAIVTGYEVAPINSLSEITLAEAMKAPAEAAVSIVVNITVKTALEQRISNRAAEIAEVRARFEAELAVIAYEVAPISTLAEVAAAESRKATADTAVSAVGDIAVKTALEVRITNRAVVIAEAKTELEAELDAELAIVAYETAPITTLIEVATAEGLKATADTAVLDVGNATVKAVMELRITNRALEIAGARTELEAEIEAQLDAELAVATYEAAPITTLAEITAAEGLKIAADAAVSAVGDVAVKAAFGLRITNRAAEIAEVRTELEAEAAANAIVTGYEVAPINSLSEITLAEAMKAPAEAAVSIVVNITIKTALELRISNRAAEIASTKTILVAEEAVMLAEMSNLQTDLDGAQVLVTALPDGGIKTFLQARIDAVQNIIDAKEANTLSVTHAKAAIEGATYSSMTQADASSEANVKAAIETIISGLDLEGVTAIVNKVSYTEAIAGMELTPTGTNGMYTFTVSLSKGVGNTLASDSTTNLSMNITATFYVPPEIINSVQIMNFNFATIDSSPAQLISKPITTTTFSTDNKYFTITDGLGNVIVVDLWWDLPTDTFTPAQMVGSAIESSIQDYFNAHGGLENRTLWAASFSGDTFTLSSFASGVVNTITIEGPDGSYFFETLYDQGSDLDMSANRAFSISDGTHTANITLDTDLTNMDGLISEINSYLTGYSVQAEAVKISEDSFKIVGDDITIDGANKAEFFSYYVSE